MFSGRCLVARQDFLVEREGIGGETLSVRRMRCSIVDGKDCLTWLKLDSHPNAFFGIWIRHSPIDVQDGYRAIGLNTTDEVDPAFVQR